MLRLRTLGGLSIERLDGPSPSAGAASARRRLALLAVLAVTGERGLRRDKLLPLFWPESDTERARHALVQALFALKKDLGVDELVLGREELRLNPAIISSDVGDLVSALAAGDRSRAVQLYAGPFLDGFFLAGAPEFEHWLDGERAQLARSVESALEWLATDAAARGDHGAAAGWWQRLSAIDPRKTRVVVALMSELAAAGDRAGALRCAETYQALARDDLEVEPNPAVGALAERLRREPAAQVIAVPAASSTVTAATAPSLGTQFSDRYAVDRELGRGGTATVYLARDLRHQRWVALKILRPELAAGVAVERFREEIAVSANLQHPHILPVYEAGECDGTLYFAMPYVEGESLRQRLDRDAALSAEEAIRFAREIADALQYAHRHGIVHRDIKPENILISSGHAVVADFGLARALDPRGGNGTRRRTMPGTVVGTPSYLSPEVAVGNRDADARSDQYSLGCVVYEMLIGEPPSVPADLRNARIPPRIRGALQRALAVDASQRFPDVGSFARALSPGALSTLRWSRITFVAGGVALIMLLSVAAWSVARGRSPVVGERAWILPADVVNRTQDTVFDHALDAALAAGLEQSAYFNVYPRALVQQTLARIGKPSATATLNDSLARDLAEREGVRAVVSTAIARIDSSYTLTLRLLDPVSGAAMAAESGVATARANVLQVLDTLVRRLRSRIGESPTLLAKHDLPLVKATTGSLEALRKYSSCQRAWERGQHVEAVELCEQAVALDSSFAAAHALLGLAYYWTNNRPVGDAHFERALAHVDRLTDRERFVVQANAESWRGNRERAIQLRRALLIQYPDDRWTWGALGYDYLRLHRPRESIDAYRRQLAIDSSDASIYINLATCYRQLERYDDAVRSYQHAFARWPDQLTHENINHEYGVALILAGRPDEARTAYEAMLRGSTDQQARGHRSLGLLEMFRGRYGEAIAQFRRATELTQVMRQSLSEARNRLFLATAEREKGWPDSSRADLRRAYELFRASYLEPPFLVMLGTQLLQDGDVARANEVLDSLTKRSRSTNLGDRVARWQLAGEVALATHHPDSAVGLFRLAFASDSSTYVAASLARGLAAAGDLRAASREYAALAAARSGWIGWEAEPYGLLAPYEEGRVDQLLRDTVAARVAYARLLTQWPNGDKDLLSVRAAHLALEQVSAARR